MPRRICRGLPHRLRRLRALSISNARILEQPLPPRAFTLPIRLQDPGTDHSSRIPRIPRYGALAGRQNESFLDVELLKSAFLAPLEKHHNHIAVLILEFGALPPRELEYLERFLEKLSQFLRLTPHSMRFAVEIRNPELLTPDYFSCLREHGVAHVYNAWTQMPDLPEQIALPGSMTADFIVCRALLRHARTYEQAVAKFEPYSELQDEYLPAREGLRELVQIDSGAPVPRFIFVNNRLEGNAPSTIEAILSSGEW